MANSANILLHGLFFLQYQSNNLVVMTPNHPMHQFLMRPQGMTGNANNPFPSLQSDIDLTTLIGSSSPVPLPFPASMPQFSIADTGVGNLISTPSKNYRCRIVLPWPLDIMSLRSSGSLGDYHPLSTSSVGQSILSNSGPALGIVTLLHYQSAGSPFTVSYFAEHLMPTSTREVNPALKASKALFQNPENFDLQLSECDWCGNCTTPTICPDKDVPPTASAYGVLRDDEHSVGEIYRSTDCSLLEGTDVANCVQFGIRP
jgi:hypothetical protein